MQGGIWPLRPDDSRSSATTRGVLVLLQVTPGQRQKLRESFCFHEPRRPAGFEKWSFRQRRVSKSVLDEEEEAAALAAGNTRKIEREERKTRIRSRDDPRLRIRTGGTCLLALSLILCLLSISMIPEIY